MNENNNSYDLTVEELEREEQSSKRTAQNDIKAMKEKAGKFKYQPCTFENYCTYRGYTREQGLRALGRTPDAVPPVAA